MSFHGTVAENAARSLLEDAGWEVHQARASRYRIRGRFRTFANDIFGCIDLVCVHEVDGTWMIQVTTPAGISKRRRKLEAIRWPFHAMRVSVWEVRKERVGRRIRYWFRIHDLDAYGWVVRQRLDVPHPSDP